MRLHELAHSVAILALAFGANICGAGEAVPATDVTLNCGTTPLVEVPLPTTPLSVQIDAPVQGAWLSVEERGQDLVIDGLGDTASSIQVPPRLGLTVQRTSGSRIVTVRRLRAGAGHGRLRLQLDCAQASSTQFANGWFQTIGPLAVRVATPAPDGSDALLREIDNHIASAPTAKQRALALHIRAQALFVNGRSHEATDAFAAAEAAWRAVGASEHALAARVGRVEDLIRAAHYDDASTLAESFSFEPGPITYFSARLRSSNCLAQYYLGHLERAQTCYVEAIAQLEELDELLEAAAGWVDVSALQRDRGFNAQSGQSLQRALTLADGPQSDPVKGRAYLGLVDLDMQGGDLGAALRHADEAMHRFGDAHQPRWQANTLLKLAEIYVELGAATDAHQLIESALARLSNEDAPARIASARAMRARAEEIGGDTPAALLDLEAAIDIYMRLKMPLELQRTQTDRVRLLLRNDALADAVESTASWPTGMHNPDAVLIGAEIALRTGRLRTAHERMEEVRHQSLSLTTSTEWIRIDAELRAAEGDRRGAIDRLWNHAKALRTLASGTHNALFAELLLNRQADVRTAAADLLAAPLSDADNDDVERARRLWSFIAARRPITTDGRPTIAPAVVIGFDRALARELLPSPTSRISATNLPSFSALLAMLRDSPPAIPPRVAESDAAELDDVRRQLPVGTGLLAFAYGRRTALRLWLTHDAIRLDRVASMATLAADLTDLRRDVATTGSDVSRINELARRLENHLFDGLASEAAPQRLIIMNDDYGGAVPWPVLHWPGSNEPLGLSIPLSLADFSSSTTSDSDASAAATSASTEIRVLSPATPDAGGLPTLQAVDSEYVVVTDAVAAHRHVVPIDATRVSVIAALREPGWVHVGAHGRGRDDRIGGSGLWLAGDYADATSTEYFSTADVLIQRISSQLVVINACDVAGAPMFTAATRNLADGMIRSGAAHVIAAQWTVSDSATYTWLPAFYLSIATTNPMDPASALTAARQKLWATRMFRHPFYWASFTHYLALPR